MVILNEGMPFLRETDIDVRFVRLTVGNPHNGITVVNSDVQSAVTVEAFHTANNPLLLLAYSRLLGHSVHSS